MDKGYEDFVMPFGKYKGELLSDIPDSYLEWLLEQDWFCEKFEDKIGSVEDELAFRDRFDKHVRD